MVFLFPRLIRSSPKRPPEEVIEMRLLNNPSSKKRTKKPVPARHPTAPTSSAPHRSEFDCDEVVRKLWYGSWTGSL